MYQVQMLDQAPVIYNFIAHAKTVSIGILIHSGSNTENIDEIGYAHFVEHMIFKGTNQKNYLEINKQFERMGAYINAFTDKHYTLFYVHVLEEYHLEALSLLLEIVFESSFSKEEVLKEKNVILEEIEDYKDSPEDCLIETFYQKTFVNSFLANPILGTYQNISSINRDDLYQYYKKHYHINHSIISITGKCNQVAIANILEKYNFPSKPSAHYEHKVNFHTHHSIEKYQCEQTYFLLSIPTFSLYSEYKQSLIIWNMILGDMTSSRLYTDIRENKGLCYTICSQAYFDPHLGTILITGSTQPKNMDAITDSIYKGIKSMLDNPPSDEEIEIAKNQSCAHLAFKQENILQMMIHQAKHWFFYKTLPDFHKIYSEFQNITLADVHYISEMLLHENTKYASVILSSFEHQALNPPQLLSVKGT